MVCQKDTYYSKVRRKSCLLTVCFASCNNRCFCVINVIKSVTRTVNILLSGVFLRGSGFVPFVVRLEMLMYYIFCNSKKFNLSQARLYQ